MTTQRAVLLSAKGEAPTITNKPIPVANVGSAVIKVLSAAVSPSTRAFFSGHVPLHVATPLTPGSSAIGRVHAVGSDSVALRPGQLVFADLYNRGRDDPNVSILQGYVGGFGDEASKRLMDGDQWRDGSYAEYARFPLENVYPLDEGLLLGKLGYEPAGLARFMSVLVAAGGFLQAKVGAGDSVIVAPATGFFGGDAVRLAVALGARVVAAARSKEALDGMAGVFGATGRFETVVLSGDVDTDAKALKAAAGNQGRGANVYMDISPPAAAKSTHIAACFGALAPLARVILMGGIQSGVEIPYGQVMRNSISIQGKFMYEREHVEQVIRLLETGLLKIGPEGGNRIAGKFKLEEADKAFGEAEKQGWDSTVVIEP